MSHRNLLIWDAEGNPKCNQNLDRFTIFWSSPSPDGYYNSISIPELVESNADELRMRYVSWIHEVGATIIQNKKVIDHFSLGSGLNIWSTSLLVEKCNFTKSTYITDLIKLMALIDWILNRKINSIRVMSSNKSLVKVLKNWCLENNINIEWLKPGPKFLSPKSKKIPISKFVPHPIKALLWFGKYIALRWGLSGVGVRNWETSGSEITFISYLFNINKSSIVSGEFESSYWGPLPEIMADKNLKSNWLHLYIEDSLMSSARVASKYIEKINSKNKDKQIHVTVDSFLSLRVVAKTLLDWLNLLRRGIGLKIANQIPRLGSVDVYPFFQEDWKRSFFGADSINNVLNFHLFHEAFSRIKHQKLAFYLLENQGWERVLLNAWRSLGHGEINGYAHATIRFWDLRYFNDLGGDGAENIIPAPDKLAVNGPEAKRICLEYGFPESKLLEVEALRYLYINRAFRRRKEFKAAQADSFLFASSQKKIRVLVLTDYTESQTRLQMGFLNRIAPQLSSNLSIIVKPHPGYLISLIEYPRLKFTLADAPLSELLITADVVYASSMTSAAVDAYCMNIPVIVVLDQATLNLSPLRNFQDVKFVRSSQELLSALHLVFDTPKSYRMQNAIFNLDDNLQKWSEIFFKI